MKKRLIIALAILLLITVLSGLGYTMLAPEIVVVNHSSHTVEEVVIRLPSNRIVFGNVPVSQEATIYYSWTQRDGVYEYEVKLIGQNVISGRCGYVTNHEIGKQLILTVEKNLEITCTENSKV